MIAVPINCSERSDRGEGDEACRSLPDPPGHEAREEEVKGGEVNWGRSEVVSKAKDQNQEDEQESDRRGWECSHRTDVIGDIGVSCAASSAGVRRKVEREGDPPRGERCSAKGELWPKLSPLGKILLKTISFPMGKGAKRLGQREREGGNPQKVLMVVG